MSSPSSSPPASSPPSGMAARKRARQTSSEVHTQALSTMFPSPPSTVASGSPRAKRRREAASDSTSSSEGVCIIQEEYRAGGPFLCVLPAQTLALTDDDVFSGDPARGANLISAVITILQRYQVQMKTISGPFRRRGVYEVKGNRPDRVLLIEAKKEDDSAWYNVIEAILNLFAGLEHEDLNVELLDDRANEFNISPILRDDPFVSRWPSLKPRVMQVLNDPDCKIPWKTVDCVRLGYQASADETPSSITVLITIDEHAIALNNTWLRHEIQQTLNAAGAPSVAVRIFRGGFFLCVGESKDYKIKADMGSAISLPGTNNTGTLGGYVSVAEMGTGQKKIVGVTCHHILRPENHPSIADIDLHGVRPGQLPNIAVMQPSQSTHDKELKEIYKIRRSAQALLTGNRRLMKNRTGQEQERQLDRAKLDDRTANQDLMNRKQFVTTYGQLGTCWCSSGMYRRTPNNARLDWALIDLASNRKGAKNELPPKSEMTGEDATEWDPAYKYIIGIDSMGNCPKLYKIGATTGQTSGSNNGILSVVLASDPQHQLEPSMDWTVVSSREKQDSYCFAQPGDSGAFVMDEYADLVGIIFGGNTQTGIAYVTDINDVFNDINQTLAPNWSLALMTDV
ncbi:MAG: hypothetical protein M1836_003356 [Candelina mexicana]|nr:MAG: hypothetical protein M1836_003356 [Candelina mexicana]